MQATRPRNHKATKPQGDESAGGLKKVTKGMTTQERDGDDFQTGHGGESLREGW
jgi:hypothetical protein